jgi:hypothetical protein
MPTIERALIETLPKAELHMHLEGSLEADLLFRLAGRNRVSLRWSSEAALREHPDDARLHWGRALAALVSGDWALGWQEYGWRKQHPMTVRFWYDCERAATEAMRNPELSRWVRAVGVLHSLEQLLHA